MLKTSDIKSMAQILRNMKHPPVKEDTDKDEPGTQGDKEEYQRKRKEIAKKFGVESCSALKDEEKRKACYAALDAAHVSDDEEEDEDDDPVGKNEEVDITESVALQVKMAFSDAGVKHRWKGDKLYVKRKDRRKALHALTKSFKKGGAHDIWFEEVEGGGTGTGSGIEEVEITEADKKYPPTIETLKMIVKDKQNQVVKFKDGNARVDGYSASAMTQVYDAMKKPDLKKNFEKMIETKAGFLKIQTFAFSMVK